MDSKYAYTFTIDADFVSTTDSLSHEWISGFIVTDIGHYDPTKMLMEGSFERASYEIDGKRYDEEEFERILQSNDAIYYRVYANYIPSAIAFQWWLRYSHIYVHVDELESAFLQQIRPTFNVIEMRTIIAPFSFRFSPFFDTTYCKYHWKETGKMGYAKRERIADIRDQPESKVLCGEPSMFVNGRKYSDDTAYMAFPNVMGTIPGNIYLMTSFFGTTVLYFIYMSTLLGRYTLQFILQEEGRIARMIRRNALGVMGLALGIVLGVLRVAL